MIKTVLKIDGMMCGMCEAHMNDAIRAAFRVKKVTSSHTKGETVILTDGAVNEEKLSTAIEETGYRLLDVKEEPYQKEGFFARLFKK